MAVDLLLRRTYSVAGGQLATPIREFQDAAGVTWFETIFVNGHEETLERHSKPALLSLILQEVR
jgi:hypothetical protein